MKEKFKLNPNTLLFIIILVVVLVVNIITTLIASIPSKVSSLQSYNDAVLPLNIIDLFKFLILLAMGWLVFSLAKKVVRGEKWNNKYYRNIKQTGWLSVFVVLLGTISSVVREDYISQGKDISNIAADPTIYGAAISQALFSSPLSWFLIVCIFLIADLLEYVNQK